MNTNINHILISYKPYIPYFIIPFGISMLARRYINSWGSRDQDRENIRTGSNIIVGVTGSIISAGFGLITLIGKENPPYRPKSSWIAILTGTLAGCVFYDICSDMCNIFKIYIYGVLNKIN